MNAFKAADGEPRPMYMAHELGNPAAPLPLTRCEAITQAHDLNVLGLSWPAVALTMGHYHGWHITAGGWRESVNKWCSGVPRRPRGLPFGQAAA